MFTAPKPTASLQAFDFGGEPVRVTDREGQPWFVAADVCQVLEIQQPTRAVESLEEDEKGVSIVHTPGGPQESIIISESGLYALIFRSRKPKAKEFRRWVTSEVLPAIRRNGAYSLATSFTAPPAPIEHPAVQFITVLDAIRARGASTEKALYSIGNLFQSSLAGAYQSNRQVLPMILPPPPDPSTLPTPTRPQQKEPDPEGWEAVTPFLKRKGLFANKNASDLIRKARSACTERGVEPISRKGLYGQLHFLFPTDILEELANTFEPKHTHGKEHKKQHSTN